MSMYYSTFNHGPGTRLPCTGYRCATARYKKSHTKYGFCIALIIKDLSLSGRTPHTICSVSQGRRKRNPTLYIKNDVGPGELDRLLDVG